jgi:hypothetical protein
MESHSIPGVFGFETFMERTLEYMPMSVRMKLDLCGLKLSLLQWCGLPLSVRQEMLDMDCRDQQEIHRLRRHLESSVDACQLGPLALLQCDPRTWCAQGRMPSELASAIDELGLPVPGRAAWSGLSDLQRFALIKLAHGGRARKLRAALEEFGLHVSSDRFAWPKDAAGGREAQVFAFLAKGLGEGPHREFTREIDRGAAG